MCWEVVYFPMRLISLPGAETGAAGAFRVGQGGGAGRAERSEGGGRDIREDGGEPARVLQRGRVGMLNGGGFHA